MRVKRWTRIKVIGFGNFGASSKGSWHVCRAQPNTSFVRGGPARKAARRLTQATWTPPIVRPINSDLETLQDENLSLRQRITKLEEELHFLRSHPVFVQGLKGETLVATLTRGMMTAFAERYDVKSGERITIEVKFSKLSTPVPGRPTRRWNWSSLRVGLHGKKLCFIDAHHGQIPSAVLHLEKSFRQDWDDQDLWKYYPPQKVLPLTCTQ